MKKSILSVLIAILFFLNSFSQVILSYKNNVPVPGDTIYTQEINLFSPGNPGPDQVWDLSGVQLTGIHNKSFVSAGAPVVPGGIGEYNTVLNDKGYQYFYKIDEKGTEVVGVLNQELSLILSDPILKIKYPVLFGSSFSDEFSGVGENKYKSSIGISGTYSFEADAFGTIVLHDRIIKDVLRIKITENKLQINPCNIYEIKTTTYAWYAPSARYPLIGLTIRELKNNGQDPSVTTTAFMNPDMCKTGIMLTGDGEYKTETDEVALIVYPNPFIENLYYNYFLRKQSPVTIELVDLTGKTILILVNDQIQPEGFHSGELDAVKHNLKMGVYYFRFKLGDKILLSKVVKM